MALPQGLKYQTLPAVHKLMVEYLANSTYRNLKEVDWAPVATQLYLGVSDFVEMVDSFGQETLDKLWVIAVNRRIESLSASKPLQALGESRIRSKALVALEGMLDGNMIRDVNELLSIASAIQKSDRANQSSLQPATVINNFVGAANPVVFGQGETLPSGDKVMFLDLSIHTVQALQKPKQVSSEVRIIDSAMLGVDDLPLALDQLGNK
jgi:hypothetical protein